MSALSFLANMGIAKAGHLSDGVVNAIINHDPETASEAQIAEYRQHCDEIEHRLSKQMTTVNAANTKVSELQVKLERDVEAAKAIRQMLSTITDQTQATNLTAQATAILGQIKQLAGEDKTGNTSGELFEARADLTQAQADLAEWQNVHQQAIAQLNSADAALKHARADMERAQNAQARATERANQADADARLKSGTNVGGIAIAAMTAQATKAREAATAATLHTDAMRSAKGTDTDAIVAQTLAATKPAPSVLDELNQL